MRPEILLEDLYAQIPRLEDSDHAVTSPATDRYNCVAWVDRDFDHWWEPGYFWPEHLPQPSGDDDLDCYVHAFQDLGFEACDDSELEPGFLKIAIYAVGGAFHHVAKQLPSGAWSSKAGTLHDFRHVDLAVFQGASMMDGARPQVFMRRAHDATDTMDLEETGLIRTR